MLPTNSLPSQDFVITANGVTDRCVLGPVACSSLSSGSVYKVNCEAPNFTNGSVFVREASSASLLTGVTGSGKEWRLSYTATGSEPQGRVMFSATGLNINSGRARSTVSHLNASTPVIFDSSGPAMKSVINPAIITTRADIVIELDEVVLVDKIQVLCCVGRGPAGQRGDLRPRVSQ